MSTPEEEQQALALLVKAIGDTRIAHMNIVATTAWVGYDIIITMEQEVHRMWSARLLSAPALTYFVTRYYGFFHLVYNAVVTVKPHDSNKLCAGYGAFEAFGVQLLSMTVNALLAVRTHAFWQGSRPIKWLLVTIWACESIVELVISTLTGVDSSTPTPFPEGIPITGCEETAGGSTPRLGLAAWATNLSYQFICFALIAYRFYTSYRTSALTNELAKTFVRDGAIFFIAVAGANIVNIVLLYALPNSALVTLGVPWLIGSFSVASYRIILSLRGAGRKGTGFTSEYELSRSRPGTIAFAMDPIAARRRRRRRGQQSTMFDTQDFSMDQHDEVTEPGTSRTRTTAENQASGSNVRLFNDSRTLEDEDSKQKVLEGTICRPIRINDSLDV